MKITGVQLCGAIRFPAIVFGILLLLAFALPANSVWAVEGVGVCRDAASGPNCAPAAACGLTDLEDCSDSVKDMLLVLCGLLIVAAFAVALFPEVLAAAGLGSLLAETGEGAALGAELLAEDTAVEETAAVAEEATEEATAASDEVAQNANTGPFASEQANQLQSYFDSGGVNPLGGETNCAFVTDEMNGVISTITDGGTPEGYASPNLTWKGLNAPVNDPNFELPTAIPQPEFNYFGAIENQYPEAGTFQQTDMQGIANQLGQAGDGSQGIVYVSDGTQSHVFNAVNWDGQTYFVDGQSNEIWTDPNYAATYEKAQNLVVKFLQTR